MWNLSFYLSTRKSRKGMDSINICIPLQAIFNEKIKSVHFYFASNTAIVGKPSPWAVPADLASLKLFPLSMYAGLGSFLIVALPHLRMFNDLFRFLFHSRSQFSQLSSPCRRTIGVSSCLQRHGFCTILNFSHCPPSHHIHNSNHKVFSNLR